MKTTWQLSSQEEKASTQRQIKDRSVVYFCSFFARLKKKNARKLLSYKRLKFGISTQTRDRVPQKRETTRS